MELVPIIYSSLLVVFSLLSLVLLTSFLCSKVFNCDTSKRNFEKKIVKQITLESSTANPLNKKPTKTHAKISKKEPAAITQTFTKPKIEKDLLINKKVRVVTKSSRFTKDNRKTFSRYSVVNSFPKEKDPNKNSYTKFSKISVEYSQSI